MRSHRIIAALVGLSALCTSALAQTYPAEAVILLPDVEVRSGPSKQFYATSKLKQNDKVLVLRESKEAPGWLEIMPPQGSFSWVNAKSVRQIDASQGFVDCDPARPVAILPGSRIEDKPPNRESIKLTQGQIVVIINRPLKAGDDTWLPILPHANEVRYLPADAVKATTVVSTNNAPPSWTMTPGAGATPGGYVANPLLAEAEKARQAGDIAGATKLYQQIAQTTADPSQKQYALNMVASLQQNPYIPASRTVMSPGATPTPSTPNLIMQSPPAWSTFGRLRDVKIKADNGEALYALEDAQGRTITYVTTTPGKSLAEFNGRMIAVYGATMYRTEAGRMQYVVATHVSVP
jgi:uncharacterized protein YgiM (DUF1202 family)